MSNKQINESCSNWYIFLINKVLEMCSKVVKSSLIRWKDGHSFPKPLNSIFHKSSRKKKKADINIRNKRIRSNLNILSKALNSFLILLHPHMHIPHPKISNSITRINLCTNSEVFKCLIKLVQFLIDLRYLFRQLFVVRFNRHFMFELV